MNKRILNTVLIICLIIIWFFVLKKIFSNRFVEDIDVYNDKNIQFENTFVKIEKDTFNLFALDRDPFEKTKRKHRKPKLSGKTISKKNQRKTIKKSNKRAIVNAIWPKISYYGFVKGTKNEDRLALIKIDNKLHRVRKKEIVNAEINIVLIYADSIVVKRQGKQKTIKRK